jgi:CBS-domain-containing membrane protein
MDQDSGKSQAEDNPSHSPGDAQQSNTGAQFIPPQKPVSTKHKPGQIDAEHPIGGEMSDIVGGLFSRLRMPWLLQHHARVYVLSLFSFINGCISIGIMSALALITHTPFIFPSLGPTAFLFFYTPTAPAASPHNTIIGHAIGIFAGYFSLVVTGLTLAGPALTVGVSWQRVIAAALSLGLTSGLMVLFKSPHPPAGATTLIISLGLIVKPLLLVVLMLAVVLLTLQALAINRLAGIPYPLWGPIKEGGASSSKNLPKQTG